MVGLKQAGRDHMASSMHRGDSVFFRRALLLKRFSNVFQFLPACLPGGSRAALKSKNCEAILTKLSKNLFLA